MLEKNVAASIQKNTRVLKESTRFALKKVERRDKKIEKLDKALKDMKAKLHESEKARKMSERKLASAVLQRQKAHLKTKSEKKRVRNLQKKATKDKRYKNALKHKMENMKHDSNSIIKQLQKKIQSQNKDITAYEQTMLLLEKSEIEVFQNGSYSEEVRVCALELLEKGLSARDAVKVCLSFIQYDNICREHDRIHDSPCQLGRGSNELSWGSNELGRGVIIHETLIPSNSSRMPKKNRSGTDRQSDQPTD